MVLEEYGHYVDAQINSVDAAGDEGDIFSGLVQGQSFTQEQLQQLKVENDRAIVTIDGEEVAIEQNDVREWRGDNNNNIYKAKNYSPNNPWILLGEGGNDELWGGTKGDILFG